jgi:hypothetical protein
MLDDHERPPMRSRPSMRRVLKPVVIVSRLVVDVRLKGRISCLILLHPEQQ